MFNIYNISNIMSKNKKNNKSNAPVEENNNTKVTEKNTTVNPTSQTDNKDKKEDNSKKEKSPKDTPNAKQKENKTVKVQEPIKEEDKTPGADSTIQTAEAEEVKPTKSNVENIDLSKFVLSGNQRMSGDGYARMLDVAERRISRMKPGDKSTVKMEQAFDYAMAWGLTKACVQAFEEKKQCGIAVPNDETIVKDIVSTFNSLGVAIAPHKTENDGQMFLEFQEVSKETKEAIKEEEKIQKKEPETDPTKWNTLEEAKNGLAYVLTQNRVSFPNRFNEVLMKTRLYRKNQEKDEAKKETWDKVGLGALFKDAIEILGNKGTALTRGLCQGAISSLIIDHNPIFAHATVKYNLPMLNDQEVVDLIKAFIEVRRDDPKLPVDETAAVKNGILEPTREFFLEVPRNSELKVNITDPNSDAVSLAKKIMNKFYEAYKDEIQKSNPDFNLLATNKMIEIRNMYVDKDAAFALYKADEYPKAIGA